LSSSVHKKKPIDWLERFSKLLDSEFRVPGTNFRFGLDPIVGLIPGWGDVVTYVMSALLILAMVQKGASGKLVMKMILNVTIDLLVGSVPVVGDAFDFVFKANDRNVRLFQEHHIEGKHKGTGLGYLLLIIGVLLALMLVSVAIAATVLVGLYKLVASI
jgi:hypothetical protein